MHLVFFPPTNGNRKEDMQKIVGFFFSYPAPPIDEVRDGRAMNFTIYVPLTIEMINSKDGNI